MKFVLIRYNSIDIFNDEINCRLQSGWRPMGNVFLYNSQYHLAMIKGENPTSDERVFE